MNFGVWKRQFITQAGVEAQPRVDFESVLSIAVQGIASNTPGKITAALEEDDRLTKQEGGERVGDDRERHEDKEAIGGDSL